MKRAGDLFHQIVTYDNLLHAAYKALRRKKAKASVASFYFHLENEIIALQSELISETYQPRPYHQFEIREPKVRKICSSDFRDRVVHHAICNLMEPLFERRLIKDSYACRVGQGSHAALKRAQFFSRKNRYFLKCDIRKYFPSIQHETLKNLLRKIIKDPKLLSLLDLIIDHKMPESEVGKGIPIGNLTSQHFANFFLGELDHFLKEKYHLKGYVRYMDDFICFSDNKEYLQNLLKDIRVFLREKLQLELKETVVRIAPVSEGVPFLGFRIFRNLIRLQRPNLIRLRRRIKQRERKFEKGLIDEQNLARSIKSMVAHISHADTRELRRKEFERSLNLA
ncbi:MAG: hypothetical protein JWQ35_1082 [Bacteriovoracaceae bacterium]|nr:hypothetical protein [Bacteriovoracaceae bacterium]